jgi:hypothetical protein
VHIIISAFHPVFNIVDESTGSMTRFTEKYHLAIIGGGKDIYSIEEYTESDVALFNYQTHGYMHLALALNSLMSKT